MTLPAQTSTTPESRDSATGAPPEHGVACHALPERPCPDSLLDLQTFLASNQDAAVEISAASLRRADTLLLQLLLAARRDWEQRKLPFAVRDMPPPVAAALQTLGVQPGMIGLEDAR